MSLIKFAMLFIAIFVCICALFCIPCAWIHGLLGTEENKAVGVGVIFCIVLSSTYIASISRHAQLSPHGKAVLITGCDSGFGLNAALHLDKIGMHVFAACHRDIRTAEGARRLQSEGSERMKVLQLEVTSDEDVQKALTFVKNNLPPGAKGLWGLINNAGKSTFGEVEFCSMKTYETMLQVNVLGAIRMSKAFLPLIRRAQGRVIFISSIMGQMTYPMRSAYSLSKFALECFATTLGYEMDRWDVKVSIVEPGNYIAATNIYTLESVTKTCNELWEEASSEVKGDYGKHTIERELTVMQDYVRNGCRDASVVMNDFQRSVLDKYPQKIYKSMNLYWKIRIFIMAHLPSCVGEFIYIPKHPKMNKFK